MRRRLGLWAPLALLVVSCQGPDGGGGSGAAPPLALVVDGWQERLPAFPRYDAGETVLRWVTGPGGFAVHYSLDGRNGVPARDADQDGVPDQAQAVGQALEEALAFYRELGARAPLASLTGPEQVPPVPFDVFLLDFAGRGDGQYVTEHCQPEPSRVCQGLLLVENDFAGYRYGSPRAAIRIVGSHELFHGVQRAYGVEEHSVLSEGTATWATEAFDPSLDDFERAIAGYLAVPDQPLSVPPSGPASGFSYGAGLFFHFLSERLGNAIIPALLERSATGAAAGTTPRWLAALSEVLVERGTTFAAVFADFAVANALTGPRAGELGYREARSYPPIATQKRPPPMSEHGLRVFPASARTFSIPVGQRAQLRAELPSVQGDGPLELVAIAARGGVWAVAGRNPRELTVEGPFDPNSDLILVLSNGALAGASTRVSLCVGDEAEVASCRAASPPPPPPPPPPGAADEAGGCTLIPLPSAGSAAPSALAALTWLLALAARRRRR